MTGEPAVCTRPQHEDRLLSDIAATGTASYGVDPEGWSLAGQGIELPQSGGDWFWWIPGETD